METKFDFVLSAADDSRVFVRAWLPAHQNTRGIVVIAHGAAEHGERYARFAQQLNAAGFGVYAPDHRGHGKTVESLDKAGDAGPDGFNGIIRDLRQLADEIKRQSPNVPLVLFGHSMGAALSQRFIELHGDHLNGVILSGSPGLRPNLDAVVAHTSRLAEGDKATQISELFKQMFSKFNEGLGEIKTGFEWLSRDEAEVKTYIDDPWCGFPFTNRLVAQMWQCALETAQPQNIAQIPKTLPMLLFAGTHDRVGGNGEFIAKLADLYRQAGIRDVEVILYPEGRHEMLNETNRDQVHRDVVNWLQRKI